MKQLLSALFFILLASNCLAREYLADYSPPDFLIPETELHFDIHEAHTDVHSKLLVVPRTSSRELRLDGTNQELLALRLNGQEVTDYELDDESLTLFNVPDQPFRLEISSRNRPQDNHLCSGLYKSDTTWVTQNESQGFRRITYYLDRPDVLSCYVVRISAPKTSCPILLSNGNLITMIDLGSRHEAIFHDPYPKPSYLFGLVAGDLACVIDSFTFQSGRQVGIEIYVPHGLEGYLDSAMWSAKEAMRWDEAEFDREYDLDVLRMVAVHRFNAGAMENKGLEIFNSKRLIGSHQITVDEELEALCGTIGHEYFHNWTGNRVSPRDWFQLTLKEGLTRFRDQEFKMDLISPLRHRINAVRTLRSRQFAEDAGPNAHPIQPQSYDHISNFYTVTVYNKGGEFYRMLRSLIGKETFREGMNLYLEKQDHTPSTLDDFVHWMSEVSGRDLTQFALWITQAGTPELDVSLDWDGVSTATLYVRQSCRPTPESPNKQAFEIPLKLALFSETGKELLEETMLVLNDWEQSYTFTGIRQRPVPSLNRGFCAPVKLSYPYSDAELRMLMRHDSDVFNQWDAGQRLFTRELERLVEAAQNEEPLDVSPEIIELVGQLLKPGACASEQLAEMLDVPSVSTLIEGLGVCDYDAAISARSALIAALAEAHLDLFEAHYHSIRDHEKETKGFADQHSLRRLKNVCLDYYSRASAAGYNEAAFQALYARSMSDCVAAMRILVDRGGENASDILDIFRERWSQHPAKEMVMDYWLNAIALADSPEVYELLRAAEKQTDVYDKLNPNKFRALVNTFVGNHRWFHNRSGEGYAYVADQIIAMAPLNSRSSAKLANAFVKYGKLDEERNALMRAELERIQSAAGLPINVLEIVNNTLENG